MLLLITKKKLAKLIAAEVAERLRPIERQLRIIRGNNKDHFGRIKQSIKEIKNGETRREAETSST